MTVEKIGIDFIMNRMVYFKDILKKMKIVLSTKDIDAHAVLINFFYFIFNAFLGINFMLFKLVVKFNVF